MSDPAPDSSGARRAPRDCAGHGDLCDVAERLFARFDAAFAAAPLTADVRIGGSALRIASDLPDYQAEMLRTIAAQPLAVGQTGVPDCRILVTLGGRLGLDAGPIWPDPYYRERAVEAALAPTRYRMNHMPDLGFWQVFDRATGRGLQLMSGPHAHPEWEMGSPLRNFLHWHFAARGGGLIHAGTLARSGRGVLLAGAGGSGKSGTVLGGLLHGMQSVGDDYVMIEPGAGIAARPVFAVMKQDPDGLARLGLSAPGALNWQGKHQLRLADMAVAAMPERIEIAALLLPRLDGAARTALRPASAKEGFLALAPSGVSQIPGDRRASVALCARITRGLPCYWLDLGPDPAEISARIGELIDRKGTA